MIFRIIVICLTVFVTYHPVIGESANVEKFFDFKFEIEPQDVAVVKGSSVEFKCVVEKGKPKTVEWRKGRDPIVVGGRFRVFDDHSLQIANVDENDQGHYLCVVEFHNVGKFMSKSAKLKLSYIDHGPVDQTLPEKSTVAFECVSSDATPQPIVTWFKDNRKLVIESSDMKARYTIMPIMNTLEIRHVQKSDEGSYQCELSNNGGHKKSKMGSLTVRPASKATIAPEFMSVPKAVLGKVGDSFLFECSANGYPEPVIEWRKNNKVLSWDDQDIIIRGQGSLYIPNAETEHQGKYSCTAQNEVGITHSDQLQLKILYPPKLITRPTSQYGSENSAISFKCAFEGEPSPNVEWWKNGEPLPLNSDYYKSNDTLLQITESVYGDAAIYQCIGSNFKGSAQAHAQLIMIEKEEQDRLAKLLAEIDVFGRPRRKSVAKLS